MPKIRKVRNLVIGSGAAGLAAALRLDPTETLVCTEGLDCGTSINTGSDKQTYYKLGMYGAEPDSAAAMAHDLAAGGAMHGDIALVEAALSPAAFGVLTHLGVAFPHDRFGQFIGYKTDHDPRRRATSAGPYTSQEMCRAMIAELKRRGTRVAAPRIAVKLLVENRECRGAVFIDPGRPPEDCLEVVYAASTVFAVGGPAGLYRDSVYPGCHTGAIGLALMEGARARNLAESQFGLASTGFRWNVSGSYMQVIPRVISTRADGSDEREFLREYFSPAEEAELVFLKGYQWPFAAGHLPGSSLIDLCVNRETVQRKRRVWLDFRRNPECFSPDALSREAHDYLEKSGILSLETPLARLHHLNPSAISLYLTHGIDLAAEPLEIAVCAQHSNGGLAGDLWWQSENIAGLFPVGEVNGSHGVTRPGGSALNAGQVGAIRAAEWIAARRAETPVRECAVPREFLDRFARPCRLDWRAERECFQARMSDCGAFLREEAQVAAALAEAEAQWRTARQTGLRCPSVRDTAEVLRNEFLLAAECAVLSAILRQLQAGVGSRGGSVTLSGNGLPVHPALPERILPENPAFRGQVEITELQNGRFVSEFEPARAVPETDGWFETVWRECREGAIYE